MRPPRPHKRRITETSFLGEWDRYLWFMARKVRHAAVLGMEPEDVKVDLTETLLMKARQAPWPEPPLVRVVVTRRVMHLNRACRYRAFDRMPTLEWDGERMSMHVEMVEDSDHPDLDDQRTAVHRQDVCEALVDHLRQSMRPQDFALLFLRHGQDLQPVDLARSICVLKPSTVSSRLLRARRSAMQFLAEHGVLEWDDVEAMLEVDHGP